MPHNGLMNKEYSLVIPFTSEELEEMMYMDTDFHWVFHASEDQSVTIKVHLLQKEYEEE